MQQDGNQMNPEAIVHAHIERIMPLLEAPPGGALPYPSLRTTHGAHYDAAYCWDHHHMGMRFAHAGKPAYLRYLPDNLLHHQKSDGLTPNTVHRENGVMPGPAHHAQPFLMQSALMYAAQTNHDEWAAERWPSLERYLSYYERNLLAPHGVFQWSLAWMSGIDNDAATSFFPPRTVVPPDVNAWIYLEYRAAAALLKRLGRGAEAEDYQARAAALCEAVNNLLWNDEAGAYATLNLATGRTLVHLEIEGAGRFGDFAFLSASSLIPLYAGMAPPDRAKRMIEQYLLSEDHFLSPWGVRSLSRASAYYNNAVWGNPSYYTSGDRLTNSNWQGPIWFPVCYFAFHALRRYGYGGEALDLMARTHRMLAHSVETIGSFTENYHAETGEPLYAPDFASWNVLADVMRDELEPERWIMAPLFENDATA